MTRWPENDVWEVKEIHNRAPRPAIIECEPSHRLNPRCVRAARWMVKFVLLGGFFAVAMVGLFLWAK